MDTLDSKTKEFIGISASVAGNCQPCFNYHFVEAKKLGITLEEIKATVKIAQAVRQTGSSTMDKYIQSKL